MIYISGATQIGEKSKKESNQDDYALWNKECLISRKEEMDNEVKVSNQTLFFAVADGVSSVKEPEESSKLVIDTCLEVTKESNEMSAVIDGINSNLARKNKKYDPHYASTLTLGTIQDNKLYVSTIGDSPLYLYEDDSIIQINQVQTLAQLKKANGMEENEIYESDYHTLLHYVGEKKAGSQICTNSQRELKTGDVLFLSSDGLNIEKAVEYYKNHTDCIAKDIVDQQNVECDDNLTLILIKVK